MATTLRFVLLGDDQASSSFDKFARSVEKSNAATDKNTAALRRAQVQAAATSASVKRAAADSDAASKSFADSAKTTAIASAIITGVATSPALLAGGAVIGTILAGGIAAVESSPALKKAGKSLVSGLEAEVKTASKPLVTPILSAFGQVGTYAHSLAPDLKSAFADVAPDVKPAVDGIEKLTSGTLPGLLSLLRNGQPAAQALDTTLADIGTGAGKFLTSLSSDIGPASKDLAQLGSTVESVLTAAGPLFGAVAADAVPLADGLAGAASAGSRFLTALPPPALDAVVGGIGGIVVATRAVNAITGSEFLAGAAAGVKTFAVATKGATLAEKGLLAAELAVDAVSPVAWAALAVGGIVALDGALVLAGGHTDGIAQSTARYVAALRQQDDATGYNISGYQKLAAQLGGAVQQQQQFIAASHGVQTGGLNSGIAIAGQASRLADLQAAYARTSAQAAAFSGNVGLIEAKFHVGTDAAYQLAAAAKVSGSQLAQTGDAGQKAANKVIIYGDAMTRVHTPASQLAGDVATLDNNLLGANTQLDAFNSAFDTLVGKSVSDQQAVLSISSAFDSYKASVKSSGASSTSAKTAFLAIFDAVKSGAGTLLQNGASVGQVNQAYATSIASLDKLHGLNSVQRQDVANLTKDYDLWARTTQGLSNATVTAAGSISGSFTAALKGAHSLTPAVSTDVSAFASFILKTGNQSDATKGARAALIADIRKAGGTAGTAADLVHSLQGQIDGLKGKTVTVGLDVHGDGQIAISGTGIATHYVQVLNGTQTGRINTLGGHTAAAGWHVSGGTPGRDSVPVMAMPGELIVPAHMVKGGAVDHLRGKIPGFAAGGIVNAGAPAQVGGYEATVGQLAATALAQRAVADATAAAITTAGVSSASAYAALMSAAAKRGWTGAQWAALNNVELREAGYNIRAVNPGSGAYGMAQFIQGPSEYYAYGGNPNSDAGQATGMVNYVAQRYGTPSAAWAHELAYGWYAGGLDAVFSKRTLIGVGEAGPERVTVTPASKAAGAVRSALPASQPSFATLHKWLVQQSHGTRLSASQLHAEHVAHVAHEAHLAHLRATGHAATAAAAAVPAGGSIIRRAQPPSVAPLPPRLTPLSGRRAEGGDTYVTNNNVTVNAPAGTHPAKLGKQIALYLQEYERVNGSGWRKN